MRIVVTGGAGFLGSHLCDAFVERGDEVVAVDNLSTGRLENLSRLEGNDRFLFVHADVTSEIPVEGRVDGVLHFASAASPPEYLQMPLETLDVSSVGTRRALDLAHAHDARMLFASTSEVYGEPEEHPQSETYHGNVDPVAARSVYDEAKRFGETLTMTYQRVYGTRVAIVRIFNTYGPRLQPADGRVVSNLLSQAIAGAPLTVYGDGLQTRSFCYVDDEIRGLLALVDSELSGPINLGNPFEFTMLELAELVLEVTGSQSEIVFEPGRPNDPSRRCPDISRARELLSWEPIVALRDGLVYTRDWYLEERAHGRT